MPELRIDLTEEEDRKLALFKTYNALPSKSEALRKILKDFKFSVKVQK